MKRTTQLALAGAAICGLFAWSHWIGNQNRELDYQSLYKPRYTIKTSDPEIQILVEFRDKILSKVSTGRWLINAFENIKHDIELALIEKPELKPFYRMVVALLSLIAWLILYQPSFCILAITLFLVVDVAVRGMRGNYIQ
jgi:hypothetical protein